MIRALLIVLLFLSTLFSDTTLSLKKGWQFVGFPSFIKSIKLFDNANVDILWGYDAPSQAWLGFSPDVQKQQQINQHYKPLTTIQRWQGVWIHNNTSWQLNLPDDPSTEQTITLQKGWNLISLPHELTISPTLFAKDTVWKYQNNNWRLYTTEHNATSIAPPISKIDAAEAIWVKAPEQQTISLDTKSASLHTFTSKEAMKTYIKEMVLDAAIPRYTAYNVYEVDMPTAVNGAPQLDQSKDAITEEKATDTTDTNLQESDVDESDILKHNDSYLFFYNRAQNIVHIQTFATLANNQPSSIKPLTLKENTFLQAMYLHKNKLILISNQQRYYYAQKLAIPMDMILPPAKEEIPHFQVRIYDIEDINHITLLSTTAIDGEFQNSRIIDNALYIISQFSPQLTINYPKIPVDDSHCKAGIKPMLYVDAGRYVSECSGIYHDNNKAYRYDYDHPIITDSYLIPTIDHGKQDLITPATFYAPHKLNQYPTITTIAEFDLESNQFRRSVSMAGHTNKLYASSKHLYLASSAYPYYYDFRSYHDREMIYKFSIGKELDYQAKGVVDGVMLSQYSMSEKDDILRVATTSGDNFRAGIENSVFTLKTEETQLIQEGTLTGLGKKGERIRGVRFIGDKGYVVTFRQSDPLYTIDLSDPAQPRKVGTLEVAGFSSYIHPVDAHYILTLGRDADANGRLGGFIVQLFDISDFTQPTLSDIKRYSLSQVGFDAEYTPQAFIYRKSDKRFAITYHDRENSMMDIFHINTLTGKIVSDESLLLASTHYENRGIIFDMNARIYATLFSGAKTTTKDIGAVQ